VLDAICSKFALSNPLLDAAKLQLSLPSKRVDSVCSMLPTFQSLHSALSAAADDILLGIPEENRQASLLDEKTRVPFAREISDCLDSLIPAGVVHGLEGPIRDTVEEFWQPGEALLSLVNTRSLPKSPP